MAVADPQSTTFERSEMWRLMSETGRITWGQQWVGGERLGKNLKRAVIASEDAGFADHSGVDWEAMERAWERNQHAQEQADKRNERAMRRNPDVAPVSAKVVGASTITQQLAKNLFLSGE
ncbi:MAG: monofunctional biosynthetic peptidoglycan transglycosylase, partial [Gammaproteobacteria bacterium]|nr:monofunctional biosynthetic peptidoglycan transglycosylase [Gammaproteobacteria bacterium]